MRIDEWLASYEEFRDGVLLMGRAFPYEAGKDVVGNRESKCLVAELKEFVDYDELKKDYERKKRILNHTTRKLQRAILRVGDTRVSNYLICRYLYCMKNEDIATRFNYCERQVYRIATTARRKLCRAFREEGITPRRTSGKR
ncbi:MAG: hypothetical protein IKY62_03740, partial [Clostridia bacterium]|nr:hypothetical protein [Clostridia bacterium]